MPKSLTTPLLMLGLLAGCADSSSDEKKASSAPAEKAAATKPTSLAKPLYASCGAKSFNQHDANATTAAGVRMWRVSYIRSSRFDAKGHAVKVPGPTATVLFVENGPLKTPVKLSGAEDRMIGDQAVSFLALGKNHDAFTARWTTDRASYLALAKGASEKTFTRLISCMP